MSEKKVFWQVYSEVRTLVAVATWRLLKRVQSRNVTVVVDVVGQIHRKSLILKRNSNNSYYCGTYGKIYRLLYKGK